MKPAPALRVVAKLTLELVDLNNGGDLEPRVKFDPVGPLTLGRIDRLLPWLYDRINAEHVAERHRQEHKDTPA